MATCGGAYSCAVTEKCSFLWILDNFSVLRHESLSSPTFSAVNGKCVWKLNFHRIGSDRTFLYLTRITSLPLQRLSCKFVLMNSKGLELESHTKDMGNFNEEYLCCGYSLERDELLKNLDDDVLKIHVDVIAFLFVKTTGVHERSVEIPSAASLLLASKEFSDFVIHVQDTDIPVHKSFLAVRSSVFKAMFNSDTWRDLGRVELLDLELTTVRAMIEFFYVGHVTGLDVPLALNLLRAADKYHVEDMLTYCSLYLEAHVCSSNAIEILAASDDHKASDLKKRCFEFIATNRHLIAIGDKQFETLVLRKELLREMLRKIL